MRFATQNSDSVSTAFLKPNYQSQESLEALVQALKANYGLTKGLSKFDSSSSLSDSSRSEESKDERSTSGHQCSRYNNNIERKHQNFQVKKKTELCKTYQLGIPCPYGNKCSFAHGLDELRSKLLVPSNYRTVKCKQFFEKGSCHFGPRCQFLHRDTANAGIIMTPLSYSQTFNGVLNALEQDEEISTYIYGGYNTMDKFSNIENSGHKRLDVFSKFRGF